MTRVSVNSREIRFMISRLEGEQVGGKASEQQSDAIRSFGKLAQVVERREYADKASVRVRA